MNLKHLQKLFAMLFVALLVVSCGDKDDPEPSLEEVEFAAFNEGSSVQLPTGLANSSDPYAQEVGAFITELTSLNVYSAYFTIPEGAARVDGKIEAVNGRENGNSVTYQWTYDGTSIAYQITDEGDNYFFEVFVDFQGDGYYKYFEGTQAKDGKSGSFVMLDISSDVRSEILTYNFEYKADGTFAAEYIVFDYFMTIEVAPNGAGFIKTYDSDVIDSEYTWDAQGNGTWTYYDFDGNVSETGSWTAG